MITCPNCAAENRQDAAACFRCGYELGTRPPAPAAWEDPGKTQPVRPRAQGSAPPPGPRGAHTYSTGTNPAGRNPAGSYPPGSDPRETGPWGQPQGGSYHPGSTRPMHLGPDQTAPEAPMPAAGYGPGYSQPDYDPYIPPPPPGYYDPAYDPRRKAGPGRLWLALVAVLGLGLLCGVGLALWTMASAAYGGVYGVGAQLSTQAAQVSAPNAPEPTPTPQPTDTPQGEPAPTLSATQESVAQKLLSPECAGALDRLGQARDQLTQNPASPFDAAWREELNGAIEQTRSSCGSLDSASPVPGMVSEAQRDLGQAQSEFDQANRLFKEGVSEISPRKIWEAGGHVVSAGKYLDSAMTELRRITE